MGTPGGADPERSRASTPSNRTPPRPRRSDSTGERGSRVLIIEDHSMVAETLELALCRHGHDTVVLLVSDAVDSMAGVRSAALRSGARIVLLDLDLGQVGDGLDLIAPLARAGMEVVVVTASTDRGRWGACVREGARKVTSKNQPLRDLLGTVRRLHHHLPVMDRRERDRLLAAWRQQQVVTDDVRRRLELLTPRERQLLSALVDGRHVHEIARDDVVSAETVRTQIKSIRHKLGVTSQLEAVGLANRVGWSEARPPARPATDY